MPGAARTWTLWTASTPAAPGGTLRSHTGTGQSRAAPACPRPAAAGSTPGRCLETGPR